MECASCGADIRSCRNCRFWSPGSHHDCAERVDDAVSDKERANFCDSFQLNPAFRRDHAASGKGTRSASVSDAGQERAARSAFDDLFK
jgi:hypothetical protein